MIVRLGFEINIKLDHSHGKPNLLMKLHQFKGGNIEPDALTEGEAQGALNNLSRFGNIGRQRWKREKAPA